MSAARALPAPLPPDPDDRQTSPLPFRGISLKPRDAVDPYLLDRFAPDPIGIGQFAVWCPHCQGCLQVTEMFLAVDALWVFGVCFTCGSPTTGRPGLCKRFRLPLPWRPPPPTSSD